MLCSWVRNIRSYCFIQLNFHVNIRGNINKNQLFYKSIGTIFHKQNDSVCILLLALANDTL